MKWSSSVIWAYILSYVLSSCLRAFFKHFLGKTRLNLDLFDMKLSIQQLLITFIVLKFLSLQNRQRCEITY